MITCYFGVPGVGKTSILAKIGVKELRKIKKGKSKYKHVYTNFYLKGAEKISFDDIKNYKLYDSLILFDEITMDADNRHFKSFPTEVRDFFILHRHLGLDIIYATQSYDMVDMKIKNLTADLWHMQKSVAPFFRNFTYARRVWRKVNINEHTAEMTNGYRYCNFIEAVFVSNFRWSYRPLYYKYFDSFEEGVLGLRPVYYGSAWCAAIPEHEGMEMPIRGHALAVNFWIKKNVLLISNNIINLMQEGLKRFRSSKH